MASHGDMDPEFQGLTPKQALAAIAMGTGATNEVAAELSGLSARQISRIRSDPAFMAAVNSVVANAYKRAVSRLVSAMATATATLEEICNDTSAASNARVSAARAILDLSIKAYATATLEDRVQTMEDILNGK